jgi:Zn-dependent metalloprotease
MDTEGRELPLSDALHRNIAQDVAPAVVAAEALAVAHGLLAPKGTYVSAPTAELVLVPRTQRLVNPTPKSPILNATDVASVVVGHVLAWHVHTELENGVGETAHTDFFIDARTGAVLKRWSTLHTSGVTGSGTSQYSGTVVLNTNSLATGYELVDTTRGTGAVNPVTGKSANATYDLAHAAPSGSTPGTVFTDADDTWGDGANYAPGGSAANNQTAAVDAHFGLQTTWDFYKNVLGRNGIDNHGKATYNRVHYANAYDNAFWSDGCFCMTYGDGNALTVLTSIDVAGHEMSHGVTANSVPGGLDYSGESGGLNESNSDIMGTMVEFYAHGANATGSVVPDTGGNWLMGEQLAATPLRYLYKPSLDGSSPDLWDPGIGNLNVHYSSGPNNRAFFFLSQGATLSGDTSTPLLPTGMTGIGNQKAVKIWYRALTTYLQQTSDYHAARRSAVKAAADLFPTVGGVPSAEYQAVQNAYHGINVGTAADGTLDDLVAPQISGAEVTGSTGYISLSANATDDRAMAYVTFLVDGTPVGTTSGAGPAFSLNFDSTTLGYGTHQLTAVAVDGNGNVSTPSAPTAFYALNTSSQGVLNGGFEFLYQGWTATSGADLISGGYSNSGNFASWLGGYGVTNTDSITQTVSLPSNATSLDLSFYLFIYTAETGTAAKDTLKVKVLNATGTSTLATLANFSNADAPTHSWFTPHAYSLMPYKGQTVQLRFEYAENASAPTDFLIDDVSIVESTPPVGVTAPIMVVVAKGGTKTFTATVTDAPTGSVTWAIQEGAAGGAITAGGVYTAPSTFGTYHVVATSVADPSKSATITVRVINNPDLDASGKVDGIDLGKQAFRFGASGPAMAEDLNGDNVVDDQDLDLLLSDFGN